jgi:hypothetical protein
MPPKSVASLREAETSAAAQLSRSADALGMSVDRRPIDGGVSTPLGEPFLLSKAFAGIRDPRGRRRVFPVARMEAVCTERRSVLVRPDPAKARLDRYSLRPKKRPRPLESDRGLASGDCDALTVCADRCAPPATHAWGN